MNLRDYLSINGKSQATFAREIDESPMNVSRYVKGERIPEEEVMKKIFSYTHGQVTANDFYGLTIAPKKSGGRP